MTGSSLKKLLLTGLTLMLVITGATVALAQLGDDSSPSATRQARTSTTEGTTTTGADVSGPCDEAEHAGDPRCTGEAEDGDEGHGRGRDHPEDDGVADDDDAGEDISGPCDEAEHANDPECTGAPTAPRIDNSGPGSLNSGPGSVSSGHDDSGDDDSSGPGSGDDSGDDDSSGSGSGGDDDSSGSGSSGHGGDDD